MTQKRMWMLALGSSLALAQVPVAPSRAQGSSPEFCVKAEEAPRPLRYAA